MNSVNCGINTVFAELLNQRTPNANDYFDAEGFLVCGKCHERKQKDEYIPFLGGMKRRSRLCACELAEREDERKEEEERKRLERIRILRETGLSDPQYLKYKIENDDRENPRLSDAIVRYTNKWEEMQNKNIGIIFIGGVGTGKTFLAGCIANILLDKGVPVLMTNVPSLITAMSKGFENDKSIILNRISQIPLLILDDLGIERNTEYGYEKLQEIIDTRYRSGKPLIVTTNLSTSEMEDPPDIKYSRVYDRVLEMCVPIAVKGESRRKSNAKKIKEDVGKLIFEGCL